jgi:hypothetical protein
MPASFTRGQKDEVAALWEKIAPIAAKAVAAAKRYTGGINFDGAVSAVGTGLTKWKLGTISDNDFFAIWDAVMVRSGEIETASGDLVIDLGSADAQAINDLIAAMPNIAKGTTTTVTGSGSGGVVGNTGMGKGAGGNTGILLGLVGLGVLVYLATRD